MSENQLAIEIREGSGKGFARKLRATGRTPGVFYGRGDARSISLDPHALETLLASSAAGVNTLIGLAGGGDLDGVQVLVKELQRDPVRGDILHADLYAVDLQRSVQVSVPIHLTGSAAGVQMGGIIDHALRELELECLPTAIPEEITIDVSELEVGAGLHVSDIQLPAGVTLVSDPELSVVSVVAPAAEEEEALPEEGEEGEELAEGETPSDSEEGPASAEEKPAGERDEG